MKNIFNMFVISATTLIICSCAYEPWKKFPIKEQPDFSCGTGGVAGYEIYVWNCVENKRVAVYQFQTEFISHPWTKEMSECNRVTSIEDKLKIDNGKSSICSKPMKNWNSDNNVSSVSLKNSYGKNPTAGFLYYGFLKGEDYKYYEIKNPKNLEKLTLDLEVKDSRENVDKVDCADFTLDRNTELEGKVGYELTNDYLIKSFHDSNIKLSNKSNDKILIELEAISFELDNFLQITVHGIVQLNVKYKNNSKRYCVNLTDKDGDPYSPLKWYSFDTRVGASRKMTSGALRKAIDQILEDLQ